MSTTIPYDNRSDTSRVKTHDQPYGDTTGCDWLETLHQPRKQPDDAVVSKSLAHTVTTKRPMWVPKQISGAETKAPLDISSVMPSNLPPRRMVPIMDAMTEQISTPDLPSMTLLQAVPQPQKEEPPVVSLETTPPTQEESRMMLPEFCMTLDSNFHQAVTSTLLQHANGLDLDQQYKPNIILLTGKSGIGKTFCVYKTCQLGGFDLLEMDGIQTDPEEQTRSLLTTRPDPFGPNKKKQICVALFESVDGIEKERRTNITKIISSLCGEERSKEKRRSAVRFRTNLVILTANDRYDPNIRDLVYKLKPVEVKVNDLNFDQSATLVEKCCTYLGKPMTPRIYRLISAYPDNTSSLLTKVESVLWTLSSDSKDSDYSKEEDVDTFMKTDERSMNIFASCRILLQPPELMNPKTSQYDPISFERYSETWDLGGDKVPNTLFNSYPNFVSFIPETPAPVKTWLETKTVDNRKAAEISMKELMGSGDYFYRGVYSMAALADGFSYMDLTANKLPEESKDEVIKHLFKDQLQDVVSRNSRNPQIDVKSYVTNIHRPAYLSRCNVQKGDHEKFRFIAMMRQMEEQRQINDHTYQANPKYNLAQHIGFYMSGTEYVDMFVDEKIVKKVTRKRKQPEEGGTTDKQTDKITPRMECIKLFSHRFMTTEYDNSAKKPPSKFKIKLSNGTSVERKK